MGLDNPVHWLFILLILLLVFGARRLPEIGRSLGEGMRGFKDALSGSDSSQTLPAGDIQAAQASAAPVSVPAPPVQPSQD